MTVSFKFTKSSQVYYECVYRVATSPPNPYTYCGSDMKQMKYVAGTVNAELVHEW